MDTTTNVREEPGQVAADGKGRPPEDRLPAAGVPADVPELVNDAAAGQWGVHLRELWAKRELIYYFIWRDVRVRYRQTLLGVAWAVLQPAMMMVVFTIFLGPAVGDASSGIPYPLFVYSGFLAWNLFASSMVSGGMSVVTAEALIGKIYFPRLVIPLASVGTNLFDFGIASLGLVLLVWYYHVVPGWGLLLLPLWVVLAGLAGFGVGTLLAALNVRYRDFRHLMPFLVQVWMFSTPSIFMQSAAAPSLGGMIFGSQRWYEQLRTLMLSCNPINSLIISFRAIVFGGAMPWGHLGVSAAVVAVFLVVGCYYFRRVEDTFADII
jgi:lipopolysaccharide transport system permease protein